MSLSIEECRALVVADMQQVDQLIHQRLSSEVALINSMSAYIVNSGGKRLRPQLVLLAAGACGYQGNWHHMLSAIVEFIHTATLLHDDVVDESHLRRGQNTANAVWGNEAAVLVGDFLYSRSFEMMVDVGNLRVMEVLASTTNRIAEGEVMQLLNVNDPDLSEADYVRVIEAKTARLFEAAAQLGAVISEQDAAIEVGLAAYGRHLGTAFQIADDVLDYDSDSESLGKNTGDDLAEGKNTLPLIYAMQSAPEADRMLIADAITNAKGEALPDVLDIVRKTGALQQSMQRAQRAVDEAIAALAPVPTSPYKDALESIARYAVSRSV